MLQFNQLSYWEKSTFTEGIDFLLIGTGIVGSACALKLRELYPEAKIVMVERGYVSTGASTKNAGFACFGSVTELADDLLTMSENDVWATVDMRWRGLQRLIERFDPKAIDLRFPGSWDLLTTSETGQKAMLTDLIAHFNNETERITGHANCYSYDSGIASRCGFSGIDGGYFNRLEGELNTGKLFLETEKLLANAGIITLHGVEVLSVNSFENEVIAETSFGELKAAKAAVTVNGFARQLLRDNRILPARAQVVVTEKIAGFELPGTFHYQKGYYYFRSVGNRLLIGGGRNLDIEGETTTELITTAPITNALKELIETTILPGRSTNIDYEWSGIMGVGTEKKPIIELIQPNIGIAVRMGGMGVAIGSLAGEELAGML